MLLGVGAGWLAVSTLWGHPVPALGKLSRGPEGWGRGGAGPLRAGATPQPVAGKALFRKVLSSPVERPAH